jgi:hypothetical protein
MIARGEDRPIASLRDYVIDTLVIGSHGHLGGHEESSLYDMQDHGLALDQHKGLTGEACRGIASGNKGKDTHNRVCPYSELCP